MNEQALDDQEPQPAAETQSDPLEELRREKDSLQDRLLRTAAEFDNYRKRIDRERRDMADYMKADVLAEILPIVDNFERQQSALVTSGLMLDDGIIDPRDTRNVLGFALSVCTDGDARRARPVQFGVARP